MTFRPSSTSGQSSSGQVGPTQRSAPTLRGSPMDIGAPIHCLNRDDTNPKRGKFLRVIRVIRGYLRVIREIRGYLSVIRVIRDYLSVIRVIRGYLSVIRVIRGSKPNSIPSTPLPSTPLRAGRTGIFILHFAICILQFLFNLPVAAERSHRLNRPLRCRITGDPPALEKVHCMILFSPEG